MPFQLNIFINEKKRKTKLQNLIFNHRPIKKIQIFKLHNILEFFCLKDRFFAYKKYRRLISYKHFPRSCVIKLLP